MLLHLLSCCRFLLFKLIICVYKARWGNRVRAAIMWRCSRRTSVVPLGVGGGATQNQVTCTAALIALQSDMLRWHVAGLPSVLLQWIQPSLKESQRYRRCRSGARERRALKEAELQNPVQTEDSDQRDVITAADCVVGLGLGPRPLYILTTLENIL